MSSNTFRLRATCALAFLCAGLLAGCSRNDATQAPAPALVQHGDRIEIPADSPLRKRVKVAPVQMHQAPHALEFPATVEADPAHMANVLPPLGGRVMALKVGLGDHVQQGQLLVVIASGDMAQAYADADKARDALNLAQKALNRARGVQAAGGAAAKDLEADQSSVNQAQAEYRRAQTRLAALGGTADAKAGARPIEVRAPIAGTVTALSVAPGMTINDPTQAIMTIANLGQVWVTALVPADKLGLIAKGQTAQTTLPAYPGRVFRGKVTTVAAVLDPDSGRDRVRIAMANADHALKPNMYARTRIAVPQPAQVFVPQSALLMNNDNTTVFVEVAPWTFERRTVELSYSEGEEARVVEGLKAGDRVIVAGGVLLND